MRRVLLFILALLLTVATLTLTWFWLDSFKRPTYHEYWLGPAFHANANQFGQWTTAHGPITDHPPDDEYIHELRVIGALDGFHEYRTGFLTHEYRTGFLTLEPTSSPTRIVVAYRNIPYGLAIPISLTLSALCIFLAAKRRLRSLLAYTFAVIAVSLSLLWIRNPATLNESDGLSRSWVIDGGNSASYGFFFHGGCVILASQQDSAPPLRRWIPPYNVASWIIAPRHNHFSSVTTFGFGQGKSSYIAFLTLEGNLNRQWLSIPLWFLIALTAIPSLLLAKPLRKRPKPGLCPNCSYDLRAHNPGDSCPECGTIIAQPSTKK